MSLPLQWWSNWPSEKVEAEAEAAVEVEAAGVELKIFLDLLGYRFRSIELQQVQQEIAYFEVHFRLPFLSCSTNIVCFEGP